MEAMLNVTFREVLSRIIKCYAHRMSVVRAFCFFLGEGDCLPSPGKYWLFKQKSNLVVAVLAVAVLVEVVVVMLLVKGGRQVVFGWTTA